MPKLNPEKIQELLTLQQETGDDTLLREVLLSYQDNTEAYLRELKTAQSEQNLKSMQDIAHALKSSSAMIGADHLSTLCSELEQGARESTLTHPVALVDSISHAYQEVVVAITQQLGQ